MRHLKGSETEKNLLSAFLGESAARNRYDFFSKIAKKEGYLEISELFSETAVQEQNHAKNFYKFLESSEIEISLKLSHNPLGSTLENLKEAIAGELTESDKLYPKFAQTAKEEGFSKIAAKFSLIAVAEKTHAKRFENALKSLKNETIFKSENVVSWYCIKCGYVHQGVEALKTCPACLHPQGYFKIIEL